MACIAECQTFLWGGTGTPTTDDAGRCSCACGDQGWSEYSILGQASCVPIQAHVIFGAVGLALTMASTCHVAYQLHRQVKFHAREISASASPIEECRLHFHIVVIIHNCLGLGYFFMVLLLESNQLWKSTILLAGLTQFTVGIGGVLTIRMWIYTNDPRLMQETPEILAISHALERPMGRYKSYGLFCIGAAVATVLASARRSYAAVVVATGAFQFLIVVSNSIILKCGTSLIHTINRSLRKNSGQPQTIGSSASAAAGSRQNENLITSTLATSKERNLDNLLAARKKIMMALSICMGLAVKTTLLLMFAVFSAYGMAAPLLFLAIPMGIAPLFWWTVNVQLHAGRSKTRGKPGQSNVVSRETRVVPTQAPTSP